MTFWPSLALIAILLMLGEPLCGCSARISSPAIADVHHRHRLLARAAVGPAERFSTCSANGGSCAHAYAGAFLLNVALASC